jgi:hypothetical protein
MVRALARSLYTQTQHNPPHNTQPRGPAKGDQANANVSETYLLFILAKVCRRGKSTNDSRVGDVCGPARV